MQTYYLPLTALTKFLEVLYTKSFEEISLLLCKIAFFQTIYALER
jgi:hypothetical protein